MYSSRLYTQSGKTVWNIDYRRPCIYYTVLNIDPVLTRFPTSARDQIGRLNSGYYSSTKIRCEQRCGFYAVACEYNIWIANCQGNGLFKSYRHCCVTFLPFGSFGSWYVLKFWFYSVVFILNLRLVSLSLLFIHVQYVSRFAFSDNWRAWSYFWRYVFDAFKDVVPIKIHCDNSFPCQNKDQILYSLKVTLKPHQT